MAEFKGKLFEELENICKNADCKFCATTEEELEKWKRDECYTGISNCYQGDDYFLNCRDKIVEGDQ